MRIALKISMALLAVSSLLFGGMDPATQKALDLKVPVLCFHEEKPVSGGTAFPLDKTHLMTAGHVHCEVDEQMRIQANANQWIDVKSENESFALDYDAQVISVPEAKFKTKAEFRDALLGEITTGAGIAMSGLVTKGSVMRIMKDLIFTSNAPIGGQSGSALVGDDGLVVGMTIEAIPGFTGDWPTSFVDGAIPARVLAGLWDSYKKENHVR